jgi:predicted NACHT family NTPase
LADFTDNQIQTYARKWFQDQPEKLPQFFNEFEKDENRNLRELARTPLLLGLLCLAFDSTMTFPKRRVEIYEEAIEALLKKWDSSRAIKRDDIYRGLSLGRKRQMFARIAADTFQANEYFVPEKKLAAKVVECLVKLPDSPPVTDIDS